jgi:hypothetical protein
VRRPTGPGAVDQRSNSLFVIARLYNFDTDWHELKTEHKLFLDGLKVRAKAAGGIYLLGMASRSGGDAHNLALSQRRRESVVKYVTTLAGKTLPVEGGWAGDQYAFGPNEDHPFDRAVILTMWTAHPPTPPLPKVTPIPPIVVPPPAPPVHRRFQIRMMSAFCTSISIRAIFEIEDCDVHERFKYDFRGIGPPLPGLPVSWTGAGPWNEFVTLTPLSAGDFAGTAEMESITSPPGKGPNCNRIHPPSFSAPADRPTYFRNRPF